MNLKTALSKQGLIAQNTSLYIRNDNEKAENI